MRMFLWDLTNPQRDGALENDIVVHEVRGIIAPNALTLSFGCRIPTELPTG